MSNITTYSTEYHIFSPVFLLIFLVFLGFIYHLIRNKEYKDTLMASIIIGFIFGLIFNTSPDMVKTLKEDLIFIILVIIGGFLSVSLKKLTNKRTTKQHDIPTPKPLKSHNWWDKQNPKSQAIIIIIVCIFSLILIISAYSISTPVKDPVKLNLYPDIYSGEINLEETFNNNEGNVFFITNNTTKFTFNGSSEPNTTVKITANELGIHNQTVQLDPNNNFSYNLSIPKNVSVIEIAVEATKPGKDNTIVTLYLKR